AGSARSAETKRRGSDPVAASPSVETSLDAARKSACATSAQRRQIALGDFHRHRAGDRDYLVLALVAHHQVRGPGLQLVIVDEPADHVGGGELQGAVERGGEFGLAAYTYEVVAGFETWSAHPGVLAHIYGELDIHGGFDAGSGRLSIGLQGVAIAH